MCLSGVVLEIVHCVSQWGSVGDCSLCVSVRQYWRVFIVCLSGVILVIVHCVSQGGSIGDCSMCVSVG